MFRISCLPAVLPEVLFGIKTLTPFQAHAYFNDAFAKLFRPLLLTNTTPLRPRLFVPTKILPPPLPPFQDTRPHSPKLAALALLGIKLVGGEGLDQGVLTTPMLHHCVR